MEEIDKARSSGSAIRIIAGFEARILENGDIDFPEEYEGHFVVAAFIRNTDPRINGLTP